MTDIQKAVEPVHYKGYIGSYQWLDAMSKIPTLRDATAFEGALELQIRKYLDRRGQKDDPIQELKKARFYLQYLIEFLERTDDWGHHSIATHLQEAQKAFDNEMQKAFVGE